jgi:predicted nicotinamide N-methyase
VQSGQYLWPAAAAMGQYLVDNWVTLQSSSILELGAGVGLAGLVASKLKGTKKVVLTDYDHGSLQLLNENTELNKTATDTCDITVEFLEWGKSLNSSSSNTIKEDCSISSIEDQSNSKTIVPSNNDDLFQLILGTDLLYCADIVDPLFKSVKLLMMPSKLSRFILTSSFQTGELIEEKIDIICKNLGFIREEMISLDELRNISRVEYFMLAA